MLKRPDSLDIIPDDNSFIEGVWNGLRRVRMPWSPTDAESSKEAVAEWSCNSRGSGRRQRASSITKANIDLANQCGRALSKRRRTRQNERGLLRQLWVKVWYEWLAARRLRLFVRASSLVIFYLGIGIAYYSSTQV